MRAVALAAALAVTIAGVVRGTFAIGGSDSSCYALMADAFAHGHVQPTFALAERVPWPDGSRTFAPAGFIPSSVRPSAASPICSPGFSLLMVPFLWSVGRDGIFFVTPLAAGLLVWCSFLVARHLAGPAAGALGSVLVATSPIVLFQALQPMNDIATTALWMTVVAAATMEERRRWWIMGALTGIAVLVRPNLAPLGLAVGAWVLGGSKGGSKSPTRRAIEFAGAFAPGFAAMVALNWMLYGHPARLGYGSAGDLFSADSAATNFFRYGRTFIETQTPFALLAILAPFVVPRERQALVWLCLSLAALCVGIYLFYRPFEEWWYLRFFLPAIAIATTLAASAAVLLLRRTALVALAGVALAVFGVQAATARQAFELQRLEARLRDTGEFVRDRLPQHALFFTIFESGSIRYHAQREAVLWDALDPSWLERAIEWTRAEGYEPFIVLERWEEPSFRSRFAAQSALGALDWPPRVEIDRQVRIYAPADRDPYLSGKPVPTEYILDRQ
jgi:hypothetical protein